VQKGWRGVREAVMRCDAIAVFVCFSVCLVAMRSDEWVRWLAR
jgi:hypothetical protein